MDKTLLDNPIWSSLTTTHASLALGSGLARRFPARIGPLAGLREETPDAFADLQAVAPEGDISILFLEKKLELPEGWHLLREETLVQMVCWDPPVGGGEVETLGEGDIDEMIALAKLTEPGPFREGTASLGGFVGIRAEGRLAAMAGQRLAPTGFTEVSAVCTHPDFRGRGYAKTVVGAVAREIHASGRVPFLTSLKENPGAIRVYEQVGFRVRREFSLAVVKMPGSKP